MLRSVLLTLLVSVAFAQFGEDDPFNTDEKWCGDDNCYDVLGIDPSATRKEIKKRYRELSLTQHPDKFTPGSPEQKEAEEKFKKTSRAHDVLSNSKKRKQYDKYLAMKKNMDSPKEHPIVVLVLMCLVTFVVVHLWKTQLYEKDRKAIVSHKVIENWIIENTDAGTIKKTKSKRKKSIKERRQGRSSEDDEFRYTDQQITDALAATDFLWPGWNGKPTYVGSAMSTLYLPVQFLSLTYNNVRWLIVYGILRKEYSDADCEYLCYTECDLGYEGWSMLTNAEKIERLNRPDKPYNKASLIRSLVPQTDEADAATKKTS